MHFVSVAINEAGINEAALFRDASLHFNSLSSVFFVELENAKF